MPRPRVLAVLLACAAVVAAAAPAPALSRPIGWKAFDAHSVVAVIDTGVNPYHPVFRDRSDLARKHPSTYLKGYPRDAVALRLSLDLPYDKAVARDAAVWENVDTDTLYWVPGTKLVGLIRFGSGGTSCPYASAPPATVLNQSCPERPLLDDVGHGTMTASRAGGIGTSLAAGSRVVAIEGLGTKGVRWAADAGWIDVQSNSWLSFVPQPADALVADTTAAFAHAAGKMFTVAASGNGAGFIGGVAPTPTYALSTAAPGVVLVGGHDNGRVTAWAGAPAHVVADAYAGLTAMSTSKDIKPHPVACCTSAAAPYAAGGAAAIVEFAREQLRDPSVGIRDGVVARGRKGLVKTGPLADGVFTLAELKSLYFHTARPRPGEHRHDGLVHWAGAPRQPDFTEYGPGANPYCQGCTTMPVRYADVPAAADLFPLVGYGAVDEQAVTLAYQVLAGARPEPARPADDASYARDQQLRQALPHD